MTTVAIRETGCTAQIAAAAVATPGEEEERETEGETEAERKTETEGTKEATCIRQTDPADIGSIRRPLSQAKRDNISRRH